MRTEPYRQRIPLSQDHQAGFVPSQTTPLPPLRFSLSLGASQCYVPPSHFISHSSGGSSPPTPSALLCIRFIQNLTPSQLFMKGSSRLVATKASCTKSSSWLRAVSSRKPALCCAELNDTHTADGWQRQHMEGVSWVMTGTGSLGSPYTTTPFNCQDPDICRLNGMFIARKSLTFFLHVKYSCYGTS